MHFSGTKALLTAGLCLFSATVSNAAPINGNATINSSTIASGGAWETYLEHANATAKVLIDKYYTESDGQFAHLWWNSAITYSELIDLSAFTNDRSVGGADLYAMLENTYAKHTGSKSVSNTNFLNPYYDDEGWWALTWIAAYDLTKEAKYLSIAESIHANMWGTGQACGSGIWWSKSKRVTTTVENILLMSVSAQLATRTTGDNATQYKDVANKSWEFMQSSGAWDAKKLTVGGNIDVKTCKYDGSGNGPAPYTQGVAVAAFLEFAKLFNDDSYVTLAKNTAKATITTFTSSTDGIFSESRTSYDNDFAQFKGVFLRYLTILNRSYPDPSYVSFVTKNADSIWSNARNADGTINPLWQGNPKNVDEGNHSPESSTSSANQCLIAAAEMVKGGSIAVAVN